MSISPEQQALILRYYHAERWRVGTIARQLGLHHTTVDRVLSEAGLPKAGRARRASMIDPYVPFIVQTLERHPTLTASRLHAMACERGYPGGEDHFRHLVALHRPRRPAEAYLRLRTLPGEQAQVDWAHFGKITIGRAERALMAFVMTLSWSRRIFLRFFTDQRLPNFLRGHQAAFQAWGGVPRVLLYDNPKIVVLERQGQAIRFHPELLAFAGHHRYEPRPVAPARGNEKARVERSIGYARTSFFAARDWRDLDDLNDQAERWCVGPSSRRRCPGDPDLSVQQAFEHERALLLALPDAPFPTDERVEAKVGKTPYARFDGNDYSVPHTHVRRLLTVVASLDEVRVLDGTELLASHPRSFDKGQEVEDPAHLEALTARKAQARQHRDTNRLAQAAPASVELLVGAAARGDSPRTVGATLVRLLDQYGAAELQAAIGEALARGVPHPNAVRLSLERRRQERELPPPLPVALPDNPRVRDLVVHPHPLNAYDTLKEPDDDDHSDD